MKTRKKENTTTEDGFANAVKELLEELIDMGNLTEDDIKEIQESNNENDELVLNH